MEGSCQVETCSALDIQSIDDRVLPEPYFSAQTVRHCEVHFPIDVEHSSVGGTEGRKFLDYHEIPLAPAINARDEIGLGRCRRAVDEIDLDEKCGVCRLRQRELACSRSAERLMRDEPIGLPAVQNGFAGQIREGEPGLPVHAKEFESTAALRRKLVKG